MMNAKKYILTSLLAVLFLGFISCEGDTEPVDPLLVNDNQNGGGNTDGGTSTVFGVYLLTAFNSSVATDLNGDGVSSTNQLNETTCLNNSFLTVNQNNTFVATSKGVDINFDMNNGVETTTIECFTDAPTNGTWTTQGNNVLFTYTDEDGETFTDTFAKQGNNLVYTLNNGSVVGTTDDGTPVYLTANLKLIYTKQ